MTDLRSQQITELALALAARIEANPLGWFPTVGDCINVTFTPAEARLLVKCLRALSQSPATDAAGGSNG